MGNIIVKESVTLDGVFEAPEEWAFTYWNDELEQLMNEELLTTGALLLGRATYEIFAAAWPNRSGEFADRFNSLPKYVASSTLDRVDWSGSRLLEHPLAVAVPQLKEECEQDIVVFGSRSLVQSLMENDLVDEYRLLVYPLVLGRGRRLFGEGQRSGLELVSSRAFGSGVVMLVYGRGSRS